MLERNLVRITPKPIETRAFRWTGENYAEIPDWVERKRVGHYIGSNMLLSMFGRDIPVKPGYWIVEAGNGAVSIKSDPAFKKTYDIMEEVTK